MARMMGTVSERFSQEDLNYLKANSIFNNVVRNALHIIFKHGCKKPHNMTVTEYLIMDRGLSKERLKRYFMKGHIKKMEMDPNGETFDLSLLYVCIQKACHNVALYEDPIWKTPSDTFEYALYSLKQARNRLVHDKLQLTSDELKSLADDVMKNIEILTNKAKEKFPLPDNAVDNLMRMRGEIDKILCNSSLFQSCEETEESRLSNEITMKVKVKSELLRRLRTSVVVELPELVHGIQEATKVPVDDIFTDPELVEVINHTETSKKINFENLLKEVAEEYKVIILEGVADCGKTTLVKKVISDWINVTQQGHNLSHYDLLLYKDCRPTDVNNFGSLLQSLLPETSGLMPIKDLIQTVLNLTTLVVLDGLDGTLHSSSSLLRDIFHYQTTRDRMQVLITTRPEKTNMYYRMLPDKLDVYHIKINGIPLDRRVEFIEKFGRALEKRAPKRKGGKRKEIEQNVTSLITYFSTTPWLLDHFGLPIHLYLLTVLSLKNREIFQYLRTPTSLYTAILNVMKDKLVERLASGDFCRGIAMETIIIDRVNDFLEVLFWVSLVDLNHGTLSLSKKSLELLTKACFDLELPKEEMLQSFLSVKRHLNDEGTSFMISFSHKGIQEFYASFAILTYLSQGEKKKVIRKVVKDVRKTLQSHLIPAGPSSEIIQSLENALREKLNTHPTVEGILKDLENGSQFNLFMYQNVFIHLIGLLKVKSQLKETLARELVSLLERTKLSDAEKWLDIITEAECDRYIVSEVGNIIPKNQLCVRDGNLMAALLLIRENIDFENVELHIASDPHKLPELKKILDILANKETQLKITFIHNWRYPELGSSDDFLENLSRNLSIKGGKLVQFTGSLKKLSSLGTGVELLKLSIGNKYAKNQDRDLDFLHDFVNAEFLCIHIVGGLPLACLPQLPKRFLPVDLWFSDTHDSSIEWVEKAIRRLLGTKGYRPLWSIRFPRSKFTVDGCLKLATQLKGFVIGKSGVWVSSTNLSLSDVETLQEAYHMKLNCKFCSSDEINIWTL